MADVARLAGVNKATVSRALKGDHRISPATREKVWKAAKELGYELDAVARGLSSQRTDLIGVVFPDLLLSNTGTFLAGLERVFSRHKIELLVKSMSLAGQHAENVVRSLKSRKVDGMVWFGENAAPLHSDIPVISVGVDNTEGCSILLDSEKTISRIKQISSSKDIPFYSEDSRLLSGFLKMLCPPLQVISREELKNIAARGTDPVICTEQTLAELTGSYRLDIPFFEMGAICGRLMLNALGSKGVMPHRMLIVPSLVSPSGETLI
jgi:LacI family transcriptional regulator